MMNTMKTIPVNWNSFHYRDTIDIFITKGFRRLLFQKIELV